MKKRHCSILSADIGNKSVNMKSAEVAKVVVLKLIEAFLTFFPNNKHCTSFKHLNKSEALSATLGAIMK